MENRNDEDETSEYILDEEGWKKEAEAVVNDIKDCVSLIEISLQLQSSATCIYLNLTTKESRLFTIEVSGSGFRIVGQGHDCKEQPEDDFFETPYSLLNSISPGFSTEFGQRLMEKLTKVKESEELEADSA